MSGTSLLFSGNLNVVFSDEALFRVIFRTVKNVRTEGKSSVLAVLVCEVKRLT